MEHSAEHEADIDPVTRAMKTAPSSACRTTTGRAAFAVLLLCAGLAQTQCAGAADVAAELPSLEVHVTEDFELSGAGTHSAWNQAEWVQLNKRPGGRLDYSARIKTLYSTAGLYLLFDGTDNRLTATLQEDFRDLWTEDVFEVFLWPDERAEIYFEYEISPLAYELPLLVPNVDDSFLGWRPWRYEGPRRVRKETAAIGGNKAALATVSGWRAEVFIPFELLRPLGNNPPVAGARWRANFYRLDYDERPVTGWNWARVGASFHEPHNFGILIFQ